jgi:tRNA U34 5-methylaminomethyl-2-thiouridine-forming methyltransferase MnmC
MAAKDIARALAPFEGLAHRGALVDAWVRGARAIRLGALAVEIVEGDARETLPAWSGRADAWFLDGFAPARNPELWEAELLAEVARRTRPGGTFATYTAAGHVRRALAAAGFAVERVPGFGAKRHMTRGRLA